ncbi:MAG: porin [Draconibacterium sp.]
MIKRIVTAALLLLFSLNIFAQQDTLSDKYIESGLVSLVGKDGISWETMGGEFLFKPYVLIQTRGSFKYYDDEGLNLAEQDNVLNSGFGIPYALVGFAGTAFNKITFNLAINAAQSGGGLLNQAWFDVNLKDELRFRIGKFKTPFNQAYLVRIGQTLFMTPPASLTTRVNLPFDINSVNPAMATGFDIGVQAHGLLRDKWEYRVGIFNGTGIGVNTATNTVSDDFGVPSLLYAARLAYMPNGQMPLHQGDPNDLNGNYLLIAPSVSYNVEANYESSNDLRAGLEFSWMYKRLYLSAEAYLLNMDFVERQQISPNYMFWGSYVQAGYFVTDKLQPAVRFELFDRNSNKEDGLLYMPALGANYYFMNHNLKIQGMYQFLGKAGHEDLFSENDDDNGMPEHQFCVQLQFAF